MSVYFEGSAFIDGGQLQDAIITATSIGNCTITKSSLDMNLANITNVKNPINPQDAATKAYVDALNIVYVSATLAGTSYTTISNALKGSFVITVSNNILNGPSAVFNVTKSESSRSAHIARTVASPGYQSLTTLDLDWSVNSGIQLRKTGADYDGSYLVKIM